MAPTPSSTRADGAAARASAKRARADASADDGAHGDALRHAPRPRWSNEPAGALADDAAQTTAAVGDFALSKADQSSVAGRAAAASASGEVDISAADYDPSMDADRGKRDQPENILGITAIPPALSAKPAGNANENGAAADEDSEWEEVEVDDEDDVDDMFAIEDEAPKKKTIRRRKVTASSNTNGPGPGGTAQITANMKHDHDDPEGYYRVILGERLGDGARYLVFANLGKGMFSSVVRAKDSQRGDREVAIKIVRSQETMYKAGLKEIAILEKLRSLDPEDKKHIVQLEGHFVYRGHLCMVFESLSMNLREVVKRFGKDIGLNIRAVRTYAYQLFLALSLMKKANIMHADIKPDNVLVNNGKTNLKLCDLGSASDVSEGEITPYLVSRFYRAPEIILGLPYDTSLDTWSIGCTLFELYTGKILFPGRSNNHMLLLIQELRGKFNTKMIRKSKFSEQHFDDTNAFLSFEKDKTTGQDTIRRVVLSKPIEDLRARILPTHVAKQMRDAELKMTQNFIDLLNRTLELDPSKRITPKEALTHPFLL